MSDFLSVGPKELSLLSRVSLWYWRSKSTLGEAVDGLFCLKRENMEDA